MAKVGIRSQECEVPGADWQGEVCGRCGRANVVGFSVPDAIWLAVAGDGNGVLCLPCFDALAAPKGIKWDTPELELFPISTVTWQHNGPDPEWVRWRSDLERERDALREALRRIGEIPPRYLVIEAKRVAEAALRASTPSEGDVT